MQTATCGARRTGTVPEAGTDQNLLTFRDADDTRRIMRAARKIPQHPRLVSRAGSTGVQLIVTDGQRLAQIELDPEAKIAAGRLIDFVMPNIAVVYISRSRSSGPIRIEESSGTCRVSCEENGTDWKLFERAETYPLSMLNRVLEDSERGIGPLIEKVRRAAVQRWIREIPVTRKRFGEDLCRVEMRRGGMKLWETTSPVVDEATDPGRLLRVEVTRCPEPVALAISRQELMETLHTMRSRHVSLHVRRPDRPVIVSGIERREMFLLMPRPLH